MPGRRRIVAIAAIAVVAAAHAFDLGSWLPAAARRLHAGYASDVMLPFAGYFMLCLSERRHRFLADARLKATIAFGTATACELLQGLGVPAFGRTFDLLDILMYGIGTLAAMATERALAPSLPRT
jgi:hypothetical protein